MTRAVLLPVLFAAVAVPSVALAWRFECNNGYQVVQCADGTQIGCSYTNGQQFNCPDNAANLAVFQDYCDDHGGIVGVVEEGSCTAIDDDEPPADTGGDEIGPRR